jgi:DNA-directed RNA polymerase subunit RPC12/RpoP
MIDTLLNLMFRCSHRRLTRAMTPVSKAGVPNGETYVVCLDCGKQFAYDLEKMRIGKAIDRSHDAYVLPAEPPKPRLGKLKYAVLASVPLAVVLGAALQSPKPGEKESPAPGAKTDDSGATE